MWFFGVLGEVFAKPVEAPFPARSSLRDPVLGRPQRRRLDAEGPYPADLLGPDESARFQDLEVLQHARERHGERLGQRADRSGPAAQPLYHEPPGRVRQGLEQEIERV